MRPSEFVCTIASKIVDGFKNNLTQLFMLLRTVRTGCGSKGVVIVIKMICNQIVSDYLELFQLNICTPGRRHFLAHLSTECSVSYCDHSHFLVNTLASTNINQSAPNLVKMYMTIRSRLSFIMELI